MDLLNIQIIVYLFFLLVSISVTVSMFRAFFSAAQFCPSRKKDWERIIRVSGIKKDDLVYEFGCGAGGLAIYIAKMTGAKVVGLELSWPFYLISKIKSVLFGGKNIEIKSKDFFTQDIGAADYVFCYITPRGLKKLINKFEQELKNGAKVVSYSFKILGWQPELVDRDGGSGTPIYVYKK